MFEIPGNVVYPVPADIVQITFVSANTKEDWINTVTSTFNEQRFQTAGGKQIIVGLSHGNSGGSQADILDGAVEPTMWSPGDQSWIDGANQEWQERSGQPLIAESCPQSVYAPIGFGMWRPMAEALGWPDEPISWETIVALAADPEGWASYGHPEWGTFKFGHTHPDFSNSGMLMMTALAYDALGQTDGLTYEMATSQPVVDAMREVELHTYHYGRQSQALALTMIKNGPAYLHAINITEAELLRLNRELGQEMDFPLAFIFPAEGTFWTEQPLCILDADWVSDEQNEAARLYRDFLLAPEQQALAVDFGLRPVSPVIALHAPFTLSNGTDPRVTLQTVPALPSPSAEVSQAIQDVFHQVKKRATIIVILDTSGSMRGSKLNEAKAATIQFLKQLDADDHISVYPFSETTNTGLPRGTSGEVKDDLSESLTTIYSFGGTALYNAICRAVQDIELQREAANSTGEKRLYGIVVLSDGQDSGSSIGRSGLYSCLPGGEDVEGTKVFTIAYGADADHDVLEDVANRTNGRTYDGDPETIDTVYLAISAEQ